MANGDLNDYKQKILDLIRNLERRGVDGDSRRLVSEDEIFNQLPNGIDTAQAQAALESLADDGEIHTSRDYRTTKNYSTISPITGPVRAGSRSDRR